MSIVAPRRVAVLAATALALVLAGSARADVGVSLSAVGQPSYVELSAKPGHRSSGAVRLVNTTATPQRVRLAAVDVGVAQAGGLSYGLGRAKAEGRWLHLATRALTLGAYERRTVAFTVVVPRKAAHGDHYAAIAATVGDAAKPRRPAGGGVAVRFVTRLAVAVRVRLPGARRAKLRVGRSRLSLHGLPAFVLPLRNTGTALLRRARVTVTVRRGRRTVLQVRQALDAMVPGGRLSLSVRWPGMPAHGRYRVDGWVRAAGRTIPVHQSFVVARPLRRAVAPSA